jgi:hypothetical protein
MTEPTVRKPLQGSSVGERIADALAQRSKEQGNTRQWLAKQLGTRWQTVDDWIDGKHEPRRFIRRIAEVLGVTTDELLGVAEGQEPAFDSWGAFLSKEGHSLTDEERRSLRAMWWPPGKRPSLASYQIALAALRSAEDA